MSDSESAFDKKYLECPGCGTYQRRDRIICPKCKYVLKSGYMDATKQVRRIKGQFFEGMCSHRERAERLKSLPREGMWYTTSELNEMYNEKYGELPRDYIYRALYMLCKKGELIQVKGHVPNHIGLARTAWALPGADPSESRCNMHALPQERMSMQKLNKSQQCDVIFAMLDKKDTITTKEVCDELGWGCREVAGLMRRLANRGLITDARALHERKTNSIIWKKA